VVAERERSRAGAVLDAARTAAAKGEAQLVAAGDRLASHANSPLRPAATAALTAAQATLDAAETQAKAAGARRKQAADARVAAESGLSRASAQLDAARQRHADLLERAVTARTTLAERFAGVAPADVLTRLDEWARARQTLRTAADTAADRERAASQRLESARQALAQVAQRIAAIGRDVAALRERTRGAAEKLGDILARPVLAAVEGYLAPTEDDGKALGSLGEAHATFAALLAETTPVIERERSQIATRVVRIANQLGLAVDSRAPLDPAAILTAAREALTATRAAHVRLSEQIATTTARVNQRTAHEAKLAELRTDAERLRRIGYELRSDRFIKYVLDESFKDVAVRASDELRVLSNGRYSLEADGYDFMVVDHANADERRSVVTFSGGESFLASLALAVALAQGIRDIAGSAAGARLESVFIDEGFGSLDADALDDVVDALERLQGSGRTVGIITHVPGLAERIPSGLMVEPGASGSTVTVRQ
jgi:exonuclease SbcC